MYCDRHLVSGTKTPAFGLGTIESADHLPFISKSVCIAEVTLRKVWMCVLPSAMCILSRTETVNQVVF
jgi:hypothetical protein